MSSLQAGTRLRLTLAIFCMSTGSLILLSTWTNQVSVGYHYYPSGNDRKLLHSTNAHPTNLSFGRTYSPRPRLDQTREADAGDSSREEGDDDQQKGDKPSFLLNTPYCRIPDIDPFDPDILEQLGPRRELRCRPKWPAITYSYAGQLCINWTLVRTVLDGDFKYCYYQPIRRSRVAGKYGPDFYFEYGEPSKPFDQDISIPPQDEFLRVICYSRSEGRISSNFHATVAPRPEVEKRSEPLFSQHKKRHKPAETYNVHMIGVDSVSRLNFIRQMRKTRAFLEDELGAFEMAGYNKVADNTFVNIVPMMTGMFVRELGWNETMNRQPFDDYDFFWKNFSQAGYRTMYAEDAPKIAIFVYAKGGFHKPPADYYNRALALAMEKQRSFWNRNHHCVVDRLETDMLLDYITDFSRVFHDKPHFGFTFITRLTHDVADLVASADFAYVRFLRRFRDEGHLNNTILILYSDHGYRFGDMRSSYVGKVEERLPFFYLVFPPSFKQRYPDIVKNLQTNSKRLTTPFDVYETLKDILYFDGVARKGNFRNRGISMLREIPAERTCEHAQILPHWCLCLEQKKVNPQGKMAAKIGKAVVSHINNLTSSSANLCARLSLLNISDIVAMSSNDRILRFEDVFNDVINRTIIYGEKTEAPIVYQVTLNTEPGLALFEATVIYHSSVSKFELGGEISRINAYSNQSTCVDNSRLKKFCYCNRQVRVQSTK